MDRRTERIFAQLDIVHRAFVQLFETLGVSVPERIGLVLAINKTCYDHDFFGAVCVLSTVDDSDSIADLEHGKFHTIATKKNNLSEALAKAANIFGRFALSSCGQPKYYGVRIYTIRNDHEDKLEMTYQFHDPIA